MIQNSGHSLSSVVPGNAGEILLEPLQPSPMKRVALALAHLTKSVGSAVKQACETGFGLAPHCTACGASGESVIEYSDVGDRWDYVAVAYECRACGHTWNGPCYPVFEG